MAIASKSAKLSYNRINLFTRFVLGVPTSKRCGDTQLIKGVVAVTHVNGIELLLPEAKTMWNTSPVHHTLSPVKGSSKKKGHAVLKGEN